VLIDRLLTNLSVRVDPFALCQLSPGWRLRLPGPPDVMLHYVLRGQGGVRGPSDAHNPVATSWMAVVPAGARHALETMGDIRDELRIDAPPEGPPVHTVIAGSAANPDLIVACGIVHVRYGQALGLFDYLRDVLVVNLTASPQVRFAFDGIFAEQCQGSTGSQAMTGALMTQCLVHLFRSLPADEGTGLPWLVALADERLGRAVDAILTDMAGDHTVESLADLASMSRSAFAARFQAAFGRSPMSFAHHVRMQRAVELMETTSLSVDQVGCRVGFTSRSHFSQSFARHTGVPPAQYRAERVFIGTQRRDH